jgi:murein DD-endopeptidase MepM/ murein hydrolase activator NlpD
MQLAEMTRSSVALRISRPRLHFEIGIGGKIGDLYANFISYATLLAPLGGLGLRYIQAVMARTLARSRTKMHSSRYGTDTC